jgi:hypothetical protein
MISMPIWAAGAAAALFLFVLVVALSRSSLGGWLRAAGSLIVLALFAFAAWTILDRLALRDRTAERQGLEIRAAQLTVQSLVIGSPLACLDGLAGEAVETACEKAVFANPEAVAAAVSYVSAKLALLADGMDFASRSDPAYANALAPLRLALEADRFGIVAHVLSVRDSCTTVQCPMLALVPNAARIQANLKERRFESLVSRYTAEWSAPPQASAAQAAPATTGHPVSPRYDFPSAASIPPVSIMSPEPPRPPPPPPAADVSPPAGSPPAATPPVAAAVPPVAAPPIPPRRPPARAAQRPPPAPPPAAAPRSIAPPVSEPAAPAPSAVPSQ